MSVCESYGETSVCLSVSLLSHISPLERLFILKSISCTQQATKVKFGRFYLKLLRCGDPALPLSYGRMYKQPFFTHVRYTYEHVHTGSYAPRICTLVFFIDCSNSSSFKILDTEMKRLQSKGTGLCLKSSRNSHRR